MRKLTLALVLAASTAAPALAQSVVIQPPPSTYMPYPPGSGWHRPSDWDRWQEDRRRQYYSEWREHNWRCERGDRDACGWLRPHG